MEFINGVHYCLYVKRINKAKMAALSSHQHSKLPFLPTWWHIWSHGVASWSKDWLIRWNFIGRLGICVQRTVPNTHWFMIRFKRKGCFSKIVKKMVEEQSIQYSCGFSGSLFWSIILCCDGRFVDYKCNNTKHTLIWALYLLLSSITYLPQRCFFPFWCTFSAHLSIHCSIHEADHYFLSIPHNLYSACLHCISTY